MPDADAVLAALDPEQREVALATRGPVCVLAGAGTGKTRAVAHRIAYAVAIGVIRPDRVLAVTFTTKAAGELRGRLRQLGVATLPGSGLEQVQARTFHAAALRQLTHFWGRAVGGAAPEVLDSKVGLLAEVARRRRLRLELAELRDVASEIEWAKVSQVSPEDYVQAAAKADRTVSLAPERVVGLYSGYEELRRERHLVDFESVLELTAAILIEHPVVAALVRDRYRYFVVDEYQDVNPLQKLLLDQWAGDRDDVCVVGDPRQTIYSFAGASASHLTGFSRQYPDATVVRLVRNYRSTPQVVALANRVASSGGAVSAGGPAAGATAALVAQRPAGPSPRLTEYPHEEAEVAGVTRMATELVAAGTPAREVAILVRTNAMTAGYEAALDAAGLPYQVRGAERFFDRAEVKQAIGLIRVAGRSASDDEDPASAVRSVLVGLGLTKDPPGGRGQARERWESLTALWQLTEDFFGKTPGAMVADVAAELELRSAIGHAPDPGGVTLASMHAAKGLEWDAVFLPGLTDGTVPIIYAQTDAAIEEERRLLYVGVTRARERLYLSWAVARSPGGRRTKKPSRFLDDILLPDRRAAKGDGDRAERRGRGRDRAGGSGPSGSGPSGSGVAPGDRVPGGAVSPRASAESLDSVARQRFTRLREWRLVTAQEQAVPAYVVFPDATLAAIAERKPTTRAELAAIAGVGAVKLDRYGAAVIALCADEGTGGEGAGDEGGRQAVLPS